MQEKFFFSFGSGNGDSSLDGGDDKIAVQDFPSPFFFYGKKYTSFGVSVSEAILIVIMLIQLVF